MAKIIRKGNTIGLSGNKRAPKQAPVAAAVAQVIAPDSGRKGPNVKSTHLRAVPAAGSPGMAQGAEAQGSALATKAIAEVGEHGTRWQRYLMDLVQFSVEARASFIKSIKEHFKTLNAGVKNADGDPVAKRAAANAKTHLSELKSCAEALNSGWSPADDTAWSVNVAEARTFRESMGEGNTGEGRGKPREGFATNCIKHAIKRAAQHTDANIVLAKGEKAEAALVLKLLAEHFPKQYKAAQPADKPALKAA
jgi:hypothetical protein